MHINPDSRLQQLPPEIQAYARQVVDVLYNTLHEQLIGVYLVGSAALGGFLLGRSDIDIQGICERPLSQQEKEYLTALLAHPSIACPTRGCEFVLYRRENVINPSLSGAFEINLNSGPQMPYHVTYDPKEESSHWFILDRAIAREHGISVWGPQAHDLFGAIERSQLLEAILVSLRWHIEHDGVGYSSVLNACRGWRYAQEHQWTSKRDAAAWAKAQGADHDLITQALALRAGTTETPLDQNKVKQFIRRIIEVVVQQAE
ncbi:aminoglycoside adenylyltransferase domain-containing protein [Ktedonospora formicarum]|uniref:Adenylyltransferase AadA C-terminal domain-containing protein n=1 Tax=Ktedonospora formicarum TaxID=2778364 RepID=A0A8J3HXP6_9CHLR|nr:aminoglycoside adenylyltransferase domain-containing protein [Ktedonospora formicarum]GHO41899.1 hypothetical protein KSX_00620 [Ktedonospora formicarum]